MTDLSRRKFLSFSAVLLGSGLNLDCIGVPEGEAPETNDGRLTARPVAVAGSVLTGTTPLNLGGARDGLLFVPGAYKPETPAPLIVLLHGAGGSGMGVFQRFAAAVEAASVVVVAPDSTGSTWDIAHGGFGPDVKYIDRALKAVFPRVAVDPARIALAGFSDGASYALSLGLTNGDLFTRIAAFSPGFMLPGALHGKPPIYISHGTNDPILPVSTTSRRLVPELKGRGYAVRYHEFDGPHSVPPPIALEGVQWIAGDAPAP
jgi:phospholipase/carboxylesterase